MKKGNGIINILFIGIIVIIGLLIIINLKYDDENKKNNLLSKYGINEEDLLTDVVYFSTLITESKEYKTNIYESGAIVVEIKDKETIYKKIRQEQVQELKNLINEIYNNYNYYNISSLLKEDRGYLAVAYYEGEEIVLSNSNGTYSGKDDRLFTVEENILNDIKDFKNQESEDMREFIDFPDTNYNSQELMEYIYRLLSNDYMEDLDSNNELINYSQEKVEINNINEYIENELLK